MRERFRGSRPLLAATIIVVAGVLLVCGCASGGASNPADVDVSDPESVLAAYFEAWEQGDWVRQSSFMDGMYAGMVSEPLDSLEVLEIREASRTASRATYEVSFEVKVTRSGVSMDSGRYDWTYELSWDAERESWIIVNYGWG